MRIQINRRRTNIITINFYRNTQMRAINIFISANKANEKKSIASSRFVPARRPCYFN